ncbi:DUF4194 domain-containing protein [uncultured Agathobaculum sp.]|uniref:DUF4194 domain-containing protein n=1 Tax=uncultured Agathobaculum sp. TaxID=2048140 RepID=UPI00296E8BD6
MFDRDEMTDEETRRASELMQRLFAEKCIVPMKDAASKADFEFICRHRAYFEELMARCGFELYIVSAQGKEVAGFRALSPRNRMRLKKKMSLTILYLRYRYEEAAASVSRALAGEQEVTVSVSELLGDVIADKKSGYALHFERDILAILRQLEQYNLIELRLPRGGGPDEQTIRILPSIRTVLERGTVETLSELLRTYYNETSKRQQLDADETEDEA